MELTLWLSQDLHADLTVVRLYMAELVATFFVLGVAG